MYIKRSIPIDWLVALDRLSPGAYVLLSILWYKDIDVSDESMRIESGTGVSTHRKHKRELFDKGYLKNKQTGKGVYVYHIGESING